MTVFPPTPTKTRGALATDGDARPRFVGGLDVNAPALDSLRTELGAQSGLFRAVDVTDRAALLAVIDEFATATGGKLDLLFNNAGIEAKGRCGRPMRAIDCTGMCRSIAPPTNAALSTNPNRQASSVGCLRQDLPPAWFDGALRQAV